ncbi:MAG: DNA ligase, partial [Clostridia bacterium]
MSPDKAQQIGNELMGIAKTLAELADKITEECSKNTPAEEKCLDIAEVRGFLADKSRAGHTEEIQVLLAKHGVK